MKISTCSDRPLVVPCGLESFEHQIDPYIGCEHLCHYCYVLDQAETDWSEEVLIHADIADRLEKDLDGVAPQAIYLGYHSDPYQPCEAEHRQTRAVLEHLLTRGFSASLLTKSDLVLRDADLLRRMPHANVSMSLAFDDETVRQRFEANTIDTRLRIDALGQLREAGVHTSAMVCPVIPHITRAISLIEAVAPHVEVIRIHGLSVLDPSQRCWLNVQDVLRRHYPDIRTEVEAAALDRDHPYWSELRQALLALKAKRGLDLRIHV